MHYGDGMMNEEIERARKRAEAASPRKNGYTYQSPLGAGFTFTNTKPLNEQMNPYSRKGKRQHDHLNKFGNNSLKFEYEESYFEMGNNSMDIMESKRMGKEKVVKRMNERRKDRVRERGEPNPYQQRRRKQREGTVEDDESPGCVVM